MQWLSRPGWRRSRCTYVTKTFVNQNKRYTHESHPYQDKISLFHSQFLTPGPVTVEKRRPLHWLIPVQKWTYMVAIELFAMRGFTWSGLHMKRLKILIALVCASFFLIHQSLYSDLAASDSYPTWPGQQVRLDTGVSWASSRNKRNKFNIVQTVANCSSKTLVFKSSFFLLMQNLLCNE